ncbi:MAG: universal stress protein [Acidaminococcaceae bacterium]|nr:universal stress protein [Acidaminococcaceae bacterium]
MSLAETYQASVWILHVIDLNQYMSSFEQVSGSGYLPQEILDEGQKVLEEVCGLIPAGVTVKTLVKMGRPQERILETAAEMQANLIVMGSRGLGP